MKTTFPGVAMTNIDRYTALKKQSQALQTQVMEAKAKLKMLQQSYDELVVKIQALGVADVGDLPAVVEGLRTKVSEMLAAAEVEMHALEEKTAALKNK